MSEVVHECSVNLSSDRSVEATIGRQTKSVFLIHNPFVDLEGWLSLVVGLGLVGFLCVWYQWCAHTPAGRRLKSTGV
jgi:hypothetical protein